jgi:hypothetical protein
MSYSQLLLSPSFFRGVELRSLRPLLQQLAMGLDGVTVAGVECPEDGAGRLRMGKAIGLAMENEETMVISWILNGIFIYLHINLNWFI